MLLISLAATALACQASRSEWVGSVPSDGEEGVPLDVTPMMYYQYQQDWIHTHESFLYFVAADTREPVENTLEWLEFGTGLRLRMVPQVPLSPFTTYEIAVGLHASEGSDAEAEDGPLIFTFQTGDGETEPPAELTNVEWTGEGEENFGDCGGSLFVDVASTRPLRQWEVRVGALGVPWVMVAAPDGVVRLGQDRGQFVGIALSEVDEFKVSARDVALDGEVGEWGPWVTMETPEYGCGCDSSGDRSLLLGSALLLLARRRRQR